MIQNFLFRNNRGSVAKDKHRITGFSIVGLTVLGLFLMSTTQHSVVHADTTSGAGATSETAPFIAGTRSNLDSKMILPANIVAQQACDVFTIGDAGRPRVDMIDVSSYQSGLTQANYNKMKAFGVKTVVVKLTESTTYTNPYAKAQIKMAQNAGLEIRVYHYAQFTTAAEAKNEAAYFAKVAKSFGLSSKVMFYADMEEGKTATSNVVNNLKTFYSTLAANGYSNYAVYTGHGYKYCDAIVNILGQKKAWIAQYPYQPSSSNLWNFSYAAWQFSSTAMLPGYGSTIDVSIDYTSVNAVNTGSVDNVSLSGTNLQVRGWHVSDESEGKNYSFIILYDKTNGKELGRYKITRGVRNDVHKIYANVYNSTNSGFLINIPFSSKLVGKDIQVISRYAQSASGEGSYVDYRSPKTYKFNSDHGSSDSVKISGTQLQIKGWHASDNSASKPNSFVILYDKTNRKELGRYKISRNVRNDVSKAYPNIYNSANSGYTLNIPYSSALAGKNLQVISRYSDAASGEGSTANYWSKSYQFTNNRGSIDTAKVVGNQLQIKGWHASDNSIGKTNSFIILYDSTNHRELGRYKISRYARKVVNKAYPNVYNSVNSGFMINIPMTSKLKNKNIQIISRYSNLTSGEGSYVDYRSSARKF